MRHTEPDGSLTNAVRNSVDARLAAAGRVVLGLMLGVLVSCGGGHQDEFVSGLKPSQSSQVVATEETNTLSAEQSIQPNTNKTAAVAFIGHEARLVNTETAGEQRVQAVNALANGDYAVAWLSSGASESQAAKLYVQRYDVRGQALGQQKLTQFDFNLPDSALSGNTFSIGVLSDGGVVVAYVSHVYPSPYVLKSGIYTQRFDDKGAPVSGETEVASVTNESCEEYCESLSNPSVLPWLDGGYTIKWDYDPPGGLNYLDRQWQRYDAQGQPVGSRQSAGVMSVFGPSYTPTLWEGGQFLIASRYSCHPGTQLRFDTPSGPIPPNFPPGILGNASLLPLTGGNYVLTYWSPYEDGGYLSSPSPDSYSCAVAGPTLYAQMFDSSGAAVGSPTAITQPTSGSRSARSAPLSDGGFVVFWSADGIPVGHMLAQRFDSTGVARGKAFDVLMDGATVITPLSDGGFALGWNALSSAGDSNVYTQVFQDAPLLKACVAAANTQSYRGVQRTAFMDECLN